MDTYTSLVVRDTPSFTLAKETKSVTDLTENDVLVTVHYSAVNYKDALACIENGGVIRQYPMTPGIDLAGTVLKSASPDFQPGDQVLATGYGLGVSVPGGYSEIQHLPASWLQHLPKDMTLRQAMIFGTAGLTAIHAIHRLEEAGMTTSSRVCVTGATGGVASIAIALLDELGYKQITALTRKTKANDWLNDCGAAEIISPDTFFPEKNKPLNEQKFDYLIDTVGGIQLGKLLPFVQYSGAAALCGNAGGIKLETTVLPFILRGISLLGIDSVSLTQEQRTTYWSRLSQLQASTDKLPIHETNLSTLSDTVHGLLAGTHVGRTIVTIGAK